VISLTVDRSVTAKIHLIVEEIAMTNDHTSDLRTDVPRGELTEEQLEKVSGGHAIVAPRDAASGLATGRRAH
jgi:hypothetical protein